MASSNTARALVWAALAGQVAFVAAWVVAGALEPGYDHLRQGLSELAARDAAHPWIVTAGITALGASVAALAGALSIVLPRRRGAVVLLFGATALGIVLSGVWQLDCAASVDQRCEAAWDAGRVSWEHKAHLWASLAAQVALLFTPFALARALWPGTVAAAALGAGSTGLAIAVLGLAAFVVAPDAGGLIGRAQIAVLHAWVLIVAVGVLHATRRPPSPGPLIAVRPRDFLARAWTGRGEFVLRPFVLGRVFAQRFEAHREATWISERVWRIDDEAHFAGGGVERRQMYCEFSADDHVRITAGDLPDGADVLLEEAGFRIVPFRMTYPLGPLPALVRCVDRSRVEPDGTFVNSFDVRTVGLPIPLARVTFRVRPAGD